jgi:gamma-carbonic anhydrase
MKSMNSISGDANNIQIGSGTNIQDNSLVHVAKSNLSGKVFPTIIGNNVTIGKCLKKYVFL